MVSDSNLGGPTGDSPVWTSPRLWLPARDHFGYSFIFHLEKWRRSDNHRDLEYVRETSLKRNLYQGRHLFRKKENQCVNRSILGTPVKDQTRRTKNPYSHQKIHSKSNLRE